MKSISALSTLSTMKFVATLPVGAALLLAPSFAQAQTLAADSPAVVMLSKELNAKAISPNQVVEAKLTSTVHLTDGTKIPGGSVLDATVEKDSTSANDVKVTLRFTQVKMKGGKMLPIKATMLAVSRQPADESGLLDVMPVPVDLNGQSPVVDAMGVLPGIDLHSNVSSDNSGVLESTSKDDVKIPRGTEIELALAPANAK